MKAIVLSILLTPNNILYTLTDFYGNTIFWTSSGSKKSKGLKKSTSVAITLTTNTIVNYIRNGGYTHVYIKAKGFSKNKKIVIKCLKQSFLNVLAICDISSFPHNGCKKRKNRRI